MSEEGGRGTPHMRAAARQRLRGGRIALHLSQLAPVHSRRAPATRAPAWGARRCPPPRSSSCSSRARAAAAPRRRCTGRPPSQNWPPGARWGEHRAHTL
eukprot:1485737-Prymnesium_polylepis.1